MGTKGNEGRYLARLDAVANGPTLPPVTSILSSAPRTQLRFKLPSTRQELDSAAHIDLHQRCRLGDPEGQTTERSCSNPWSMVSTSSLETLMGMSSEFGGPCSTWRICPTMPQDPRSRKSLAVLVPTRMGTKSRSLFVAQLTYSACLVMGRQISSLLRTKSYKLPFFLGRRSKAIGIGDDGHWGRLARVLQLGPLPAIWLAIHSPQTAQA